MAEICTFANNCPMEADIIEVSGACQDKRGEKCGKVAAYGMMKWQLNNLVELDVGLVPILGTFTITEVPSGVPPEKVRQEWVGVELPVREEIDRCRASGKVEVSPADVVLSLLRAGRLDAADWFLRAGIDLAPLGPTWIFQVSEGKLEQGPADGMWSPDFYSSTLTPEMLEAIGG